MTIYALGFNHTAVERADTNARLETSGGFTAAVGSAVPVVPLGASLNKFSMSIRTNTLVTANRDLAVPFMIFRSGTAERVRFYFGTAAAAGVLTNGAMNLRITYTLDGTNYIEAVKEATVFHHTTAARAPFTAHFDFSASGGLMLGTTVATFFAKRFDFTLFGGTVDNVIFPANTGKTLTVLSFVFHDEPMHLAHLHPMTPDAAGAVNVGWSNATAAVLTDTTNFATPSANDDLFTINTTIPTNSGTYGASTFGFFGGYYKYFATIIAATRPTGAPALTNMASVIRVSATNYFGTDRVVPIENLDASYKPYYEVYETNPGTGLPWVQADYDVLEFGVRART